jgi:Zn-dependent M28 family amino/carboxypeptidase
MKKTSLWLMAMTFAASACAQQNKTAMKYAGIISADLAKKHLSIIASDEFEGRETGKPGADKAAHYIADQFKALGLQPIVNGSYFFDVPLVENSLKITFSVDGQPAVNGQDFYAYRPSADRSLDVNDIVFIGYGTEAEIANTDLTGKILLWINEDKPEAGKTTNTSYRASDARTAIIKNLQSKNPALILAANGEIASTLKRFRANITGGRLTIKEDAKKPAEKQAGLVWVTTALADQLVKSSGKTYNDLKSAAANGATPAQTIKAAVKVAYNTEAKDVKAVDVLGYLPGSDLKLKDEVVVISAHYDHLGILPEGTKGDRVYNGADDDGSGTTGMIELATAFSKAKKDGHGPRRSILFLGNVGEEKGLLGSEYYTDHPVIPLANTITDLNIDMIGRVGVDYIGKPDSANTVYVIGSSMLSSDLHKVGENANNLYTKMNLDYKYDDPSDPNRFYYRSDHYNFAKHGVPIIFYFNGVHADYHQLSDEVSKINFPLLAKRAQLVFYTAWDLLNTDNRPVVDGKK